MGIISFFGTEIGLNSGGGGHLGARDNFKITSTKRVSCVQPHSVSSKMDPNRVTSFSQILTWLPLFCPPFLFFRQGWDCVRKGEEREREMTLGLINANPVVHAKKERIARTADDPHTDDAVDPLEIYDILLLLVFPLLFSFSLIAY